MSSELRFVKWVRFFERNYIVKWVIFFASFCWLWDFLLENQKIKKSSGNAHWSVWTIIKKSCIPENKTIFPPKKNSKYEILNHLYFRPNFVFKGTVLGHFVKFFFVRQLWWVAFLFSDGIFTVTSQLEIHIIGSRHDICKKRKNHYSLL